MWRIKACGSKLYRNLSSAAMTQEKIIIFKQFSWQSQRFVTSTVHHGGPSVLTNTISRPALFKAPAKAFSPKCERASLRCNLILRVFLFNSPAGLGLQSLRVLTSPAPPYSHAACERPCAFDVTPTAAARGPVEVA